MTNLFPTFDMPDLVVDNSPNTVQYPESPLYDFDAGDYVTDGAGRYVMADGHTAWAQWCQKAVLTDRFACLAYSTDYGSEARAARRQPTRAAVQSEMERSITETLLVDPRTQAVQDFEFRFEGDSVWVAFTVVPVIGQEQRLEVKI
ncbi:MULTISPECIES: DUF2634 domain-containing protein [Paenibacillus]|uniref:DUF2634 domain-containing protein n=1 Tax=Paenibacillus TaxID=44249 RepID=UPI00055F419D|nr:DUF2634 domain-containing protein [Paenibacillus macerans]MCY7558208.1 DUF2634 domain-containing protein [Paenibacillus macerans]MEC0154654.1 DUF2634 domain-containing protein [Paenibacillus macerans]SUA85614.1 uncharacterized protein YqbS [Paenibacillus macerans]